MQSQSGKENNQQTPYNRTTAGKSHQYQQNEKEETKRKHDESITCTPLL